MRVGKESNSGSWKSSRNLNTGILYFSGLLRSKASHIKKSYSNFQILQNLVRCDLGNNPAILTEHSRKKANKQTKQDSTLDLKILRMHYTGLCISFYLTVLYTILHPNAFMVTSEWGFFILLHIQMTQNPWHNLSVSLNYALHYICCSCHGSKYSSIVLIEEGVRRMI